MACNEGKSDKFINKQKTILMTSNNCTGSQATTTTKKKSLQQSARENSLERTKVVKYSILIQTFIPSKSLNSAPIFIQPLMRHISHLRFTLRLSLLWTSISILFVFKNTKGEEIFTLSRTPISKTKQCILAASPRKGEKQAFLKQEFFIHIHLF